MTDHRTKLIAFLNKIKFHYCNNYNYLGEKGWYDERSEDYLETSEQSITEATSLLWVNICLAKRIPPQRVLKDHNIFMLYWHLTEV